MKDEFYNQLQDTMNETPSYDIKFLSGDMNAQLDNTKQGAKQILGSHGTPKMKNDNGEHFLIFCSTNETSVDNIFFAYKNIHKKMW